MTDPGKASRSNAQQRSGYPTSTLPPQVQGLSSSQSYWASQGAAQSVRDPGVPPQSRDKEKEEVRERRRVEKEAARARAEEEKMRVRTAERERERERERRREEKELRRVEREREKERERRREEKEQERLRRFKEKERAREPSRGRDHDQPYSRQTAAAQISAAAGALKQYAESKLGVSSYISISPFGSFRDLFYFILVTPSASRPDPLFLIQSCIAAVWPTCR